MLLPHPAVPRVIKALKAMGEDGGKGRSTTKRVSSTEPVGINNNNQPMMVVTVSGGMRTWRMIEQQVREARQEG